VLFVEKAFAQLFENYKALEGSYPHIALHCLTGQERRVQGWDMKVAVASSHLSLIPQVCSLTSSAAEAKLCRHALLCYFGLCSIVVCRQH
jgi:hypothetical protein